MAFPRAPAADLSTIGSHCEFPACCRLDFLPFKCADCRLTYCLDHRQRTAHQCTASDTLIRTRPENSSDSTPDFHSCSTTGCQQREHIEIRCSECGGNFCFAHRHPEDHGCAALPLHDGMTVHHFRSLLFF